MNLYDWIYYQTNLSSGISNGRGKTLYQLLTEGKPIDSVTIGEDGVRLEETGEEEQ